MLNSFLRFFFGFAAYCLSTLWSGALLARQEVLPDFEGLILHLDANDWRSGSDSTATSETPIPVSKWESRVRGSEYRFEQNSEDAQPTYHRVDGKGFIRFDGEQDSLRCIGPQRTLRDLTLAVVVVPHSNAGDFRGFIAANKKQQRDYESGFTLDLGPGPTKNCSFLNWEGAGFGGARNMHATETPMKSLMIVQCKLDASQKRASLATDGKQFVSRDFEPKDVHIDELTLGARYYTNGAGPQQVRGCIAADIVEVILYDRAISPSESIELQDYLVKKHTVLAQSISKTIPSEKTAMEITKVPNPPPVHMLVPGFQTRELPVRLTNVNNLRYRADGTLVTLGYNGDICLVKDSDGDGLEDQSRFFWKNQGSLRGPIGLVWLEKGNKHWEGLLRLHQKDLPDGSNAPSQLQGAMVASKGKVSAIVDIDGDDVADREWIVAQGWNEIRQNVDAVGLTIGPDGFLYFGLGTADYANAYQIDEKGKSGYQLTSDRGTIQRVNLQTLERETVCTGVRFPIGIEFHPNGDLFCTDQEGATWLPNGNPMDELLCIEKGRHYGFPPRHPQHNPNVLDEPSVFDYGPQHQSTCGLTWNRETDTQKSFGPAVWRNNALVCGESRGKLWRTQVVRTDKGYVAASQLIACLQMLTVDSTVSPHGDLVVACHSGPPDWGTGPEGIGKLYKIRMIEPTAPKPILAWAQSETELRIAFDSPIALDSWKNLTREISIEYGPYVRAGDHFENLSPPYAVVQQQSVSDRFSLPILGVSVTSDLRTLLLQVPPMKIRGHNNSHEAIRWAIRWRRESVSNGPLEDYAIDTSLDGVLANWKPKGGPSVEVWLPHIDLAISKELCQGSALHETFFQQLRGEGELILQTKVDLYHWLRPKVQPGASIDYEWPAEEVSFHVKAHGASRVDVMAADSAIDQKSAVSIVDEKSDPAGAKRWVSKDHKEPVSVQLKIVTSHGESLRIETFVSTNEDLRERVVPPNRFHLPWSQSRGLQKSDDKQQAFVRNELVGGNWGRGRKLYHSEALGCFKCHSIHSAGAKIGPDLSNLVHRDYTSVMRDIVQPSYSINPDFISHIVRMKDDSTSTGVLRTESGKLYIGDAKGQSHLLIREDIDSMKVSQLSVMPTGLLDNVSAEDQRDLMTFLLTPPPQMPIDGPIKAPAMRTLDEVQHVLSGSADIKSDKNVRIVLVAGAKDHGPGEHDYPAWQIHWLNLLSAAENVELSTAWNFPSDEQIATSDVLIFFQKGDWNDKRAEKMDAFFGRGGGAIYLHWAVNGENGAPEFSKRIGLASRAGKIRYRHGPLRLELQNTDHPILRNIESLDLYDESYWMLTGDPSQVTLLASSSEDNALQPQIWCYERGAGRVFVSIPGHYNWTFDDPIFRTVLLRAIAWSAREPIDRFNDLVLPGARVKR